MEKVNITIVGAGVVGLAVGYELSKAYSDVLIIEKNLSFGQETSSRNSEVIHAGIYYPKESLKTKACVEGNPLLYEFCRQNNIPHKKIGKLIVAIDSGEVKELETLFRRGLDNGVTGLSFLDEDGIKKIEPHIKAHAAIYSSETGIIDSHSLMKALLSSFKGNNGCIVYDTQVSGIDKAKDGFVVTAGNSRQGVSKFLTRALINCAGLNSDRIAAIAGLSKDEYRLKYCKGSYFRADKSKAGFIRHLAYPVPKKDRAGLGIHATLDLSGSLRLGPDDEYVDKIDYRVDESKKKAFYESTKQYLPFIELGSLYPDTCGIRPKLQGKGEGFRDFIIKEESDNGLPGMINLIGIESPGLTACLSISNITKRIVKEFLG